MLRRLLMNTRRSCVDARCFDSPCLLKCTRKFTSAAEALGWVFGKRALYDCLDRAGKLRA
jgi:hypothetical protein